MEKPTPPDFGQKDFWQYEKMVWGNGAKKFRADIGVLPTALTIVASICAAFIIQTTRSQAQDIVGDAVIAALSLLFFCVAALAWYVTRETVFVYNEKQSGLKGYWDKYDAPNPPCPLKITQYQEHPGRNRIGIRIENTLSNQRVSHLRVILDELVLCASYSRKIQRIIDDANRGFPNGSSIVNGTIEPEHYGILFMASVLRNFITFDLEKPIELNDMTHALADQSLPAPMFADYEMQFSVSGELGDHSFKKARRLAHIHVESHFDGDWRTTAEITSLEELVSEQETEQKAHLVPNG